MHFAQCVFVHGTVLFLNISKSVYFSQIVVLNFGTLRRRHFFVWPQFLAFEDDKASYDAYEMRNGCKIEWSGCRPKPLHRRAT